MMNIFDLPIEILSIIATDSYITFKTLLKVPMIATLLCSGYIQAEAKRKFITTTVMKFVDGNLHGGKLPAVIHSNGSVEYFNNGNLHRSDNLPAIIYKYNCNKNNYHIRELLKRYDIKFYHKCDILMYFKYGVLYRDDDGPTITCACGKYYEYRNNINGYHRDHGPARVTPKVIEYWQHGKRHREDGPAIEYANGTKAWYINNQLHREDGPAIEYANGNKYWYVNDIRHREDGPAVERWDGNKFWYINDKLHRENGPAIEYSNGTKAWYINGKRHRENGPAIEYSNGDKEWWINGKRIPDKN